MSTDAVHEIEKRLHDLDTHTNLNILDKFVPRGSQEFREALLECQSDEEVVPQQRERSRTIDTTYKKPHLSVHFASNLVTQCSKKNRSGDDLHLHHGGILRHSRERSNTYDGTVQRPKKQIGISPLCNDNHIDSDSAVEKLLSKSPTARKLEENLLDSKVKQNGTSKDTTNDSKSDRSSPIRRHKSESAAHTYTKQSSSNGSLKISKTSRTDSPRCK